MSWNKIHCLEGEPFFIKYHIQNLIEENGNPNVSKFDSNSSADDLKSALTSFPFFDVPDIIVVENPNAELLNCCLDNINNINSTLLILICENNAFDGRQSFITKATKNNRLESFDYIQIDDSIKSIVKDWSSYNKVELHISCFDWIDNNAPTKTVKAKIKGQKKDLIVHDLLLVERELSKIKSIFHSNKLMIYPKDLQNYCNFERESDIWNFIDNAISGNLPSTLKYFEENKLTSNNEGILWVIASQLELYIQLKSKSKNPQDDISLKSYLNFYLNDDLTPTDEIKPKAQINPYRLQMAQQTASKFDVNSLVEKYQATISAIQDLRNGMPSDIISSYLALAYSNKIKYINPFINV